MITAYRIVKTKWADSAFDGEGARLYGGRWNSKGQSCVYLASSESLAILEILVHLDNSDTLDHYTLFTVDINPADIMELNHEFLPDCWQADPAPSETAEIGDDWLKSNSSLALKIPSTIVIREANYLINIKHVNFPKALSTHIKLDFKFDNRLVK
ncbi:hypothetical protein CJF42_00800 [Pseudoalteromonas sp. NBT06-2]|uniref:RES family NAD+ phosphorylase n=1 Tax=Pseudoalteromonas sp. NBT06-2 TaxID=2025950 RepID=UPI000BA69F15|nr:RES domain-containing protein [Pseudoalteromonas sp. NBT06-2]PAJ76261.1 hypothetical protein CJF42_00800 [Pseudoalteromonas sp. NBT06-2]